MNKTTRNLQSECRVLALIAELCNLDRAAELLQLASECSTSYMWSYLQEARSLTQDDAYGQSIAADITSILTHPIFMTKSDQMLEVSYV